MVKVILSELAKRIGKGKLIAGGSEESHTIKDSTRMAPGLGLISGVIIVHVLSQGDKFILKTRKPDRLKGEKARHLPEKEPDGAPKTAVANG